MARSLCIGGHRTEKEEVVHCCILNFLQSPSVILPLKQALYSFFGARGIGTDGTSVRVFKKKSYFDDITKNKGLVSDLNMLVGRVPEVEFF